MNKVVRTNKSGYMSDLFIEKEKNAVEKHNFNYCFSDSFKEISTADILITTSDSPIELWLEEGILSANQTIIHPNSGFDNFPTNFHQQCEVSVFLGMSIRSFPVAQAALQLFLELTGPIPRKLSWDKTRKWDRKIIRNMKILIVGHGHIGKILNNSLTALGADVQVSDPFKKLAPSYNLDAFDSIFLACSLNPTSNEIINKLSLDRMKKNAILINTSRGKCIDLPVLLTHLERNPDFLVGLDVYPNEPADQKTWDSLNKYPITSHIAGVHTNLEEDMIIYVSDVINAIKTNNHHHFPQLKDRFIEKSQFSFYDIFSGNTKTVESCFYF